MEQGQSLYWVGWLQDIIVIQFRYRWKVKYFWDTTRVSDLRIIKFWKKVFWLIMELTFIVKFYIK